MKRPTETPTRVTLREPVEIAGDYVIDAIGEDGSIQMHPDTSFDAMVERMGIGGRAASEQELADDRLNMIPPDGEG